jgi:hypothetical protein
LTDEYTTVEPGYEYIEKLYFKIEFQPAVFILFMSSLKFWEIIEISPQMYVQKYPV